MIRNKNKGSLHLFFQYMAFNIALRCNELICISMENGLAEAYSTGILYFFKLKYVPVISFWNILNICILNTNTWIAIIKFGVHHALTFGIIYSNGGHIRFNYTHTSLSMFLFIVETGCKIIISLFPLCA